MDQPLMGADVVLNQIKELWEENGQKLNKKEIKKQHPDVMRNALYYYPSWEHAVSTAIQEQ